MLYSLEHGINERALLRRVEAGMITMPESISNAPDLEQGLEFAYDAFWKLTTCRSVGMGQGPIPWTAKMDYCDEYGVDDFEDRDDFEYLMTEMDREYLKFQAAEAEKKKPPPKQPGQRKVMKQPTRRA